MNNLEKQEVDLIGRQFISDKIKESNLRLKSLEKAWSGEKQENQRLKEMLKFNNSFPAKWDRRMDNKIILQPMNLKVLR